MLASVAVTALATTAYLWPFWREQPELSHGYFALPCALGLLGQARREPNLATPGHAASWLIAQWLLALLAMLGGSIAALAALAQGPFHSQTAFLAGISASLLILSGIMALARSRTRLVPLNATALCAVALWWFVVPLPSGTLSRFTLFLQDVITAASLRGLHLLGFPALRHGNVIQLANTLVGVEEACSGIRSLTACLFAGVVLGGFMLTGFRRRVALVVSAGVLAIVANFIRSMTLCVMAARGVEIKGFWHDGTAYAVLGLTALILFGGSLLLSPPTSAPAATAGEAVRPAPRRAWPHAVLSGMFALLVVLVIVKTRPTPGSNRPVPDLQRLMVLDMPGWQRHSDESIFAFSTALATTHLRQEIYRRGDLEVIFYVAFWTADQSTLGSVALHTPEICLPGSGWNTRPPPPLIGRYPLPNPNRFVFEKEAYPLYVWFWHYFNGRPVSRPPTLYPWRLAPALLQRGVSAKASQWVVRVSANQPLESLLTEPLLVEFFNRLRASGLAAPAD